MKELPGILIEGPPRTKKNSGEIIFIPKKGSFRCGSCGQRRISDVGKSGSFPKILPSKAYEIWEADALSQCFRIKAALAAKGIILPITDPVSIEAHIYREANIGDSCGFYQAIGDMLQKAGIIKDDRQIEDFDGSRRYKDAARPRVEIFITIVEEHAVQEELAL